MPRFTIRSLLLLTLAAATFFAVFRDSVAICVSATLAMIAICLDRVVPATGRRRFLLRGTVTTLFILPSVALSQYIGSVIHPESNPPTFEIVYASLIAAGFYLRAFRAYSFIEILAASTAFSAVVLGILVALDLPYDVVAEVYWSLGILFLLGLGAVLGDFCVWLSAK